MTASTPAASDTALAGATRALNAWIELDLDALANNARVLRETAGEATVIAVVKANAYGHGASIIGPALEAAGVERFAVVFLPEAVALREAGVTRPVLVLGHSFPEDAEVAVAGDITLTVDTEALAEALSGAALRARKAPAPVHIKVDSGMHRFGLTPTEVAALAERVRTLQGVTLEAIWTHLANADHADDSFTVEQDAVVSEAIRLAGPVPMRHIANTATTIRHPEFRYDAVRTGLGLYGALPDHTPNPGGLRPVLSMKARLARVFDVAPGEGVSYGLTWRAQRPSRVALVPIGYADGYHRALSNRGHVLAGGQALPHRRAHLHGPLPHRRDRCPRCGGRRRGRAHRRAGRRDHHGGRSRRRHRHHQLRGARRPQPPPPPPRAPQRRARPDFLRPSCSSSPG